MPHARSGQPRFVRIDQLGVLPRGYLEVNDQLLFNAGVRVEGFDNRNAAGQTYIEMEDMVAPRFGITWDPTAMAA